MTKFEFLTKFLYNICTKDERVRNMRDINRIDKYMELLTQIWKEFPDLRFGQLLANMLGSIQQETQKDIFFMEDAEFFAAFMRWYKGMKGE